MARNRFDVVPGGTLWKVTHKQSMLSTHYTKAAAVVSGREAAKANMPSQLVIHKQDGTFEEEFTYGNDPYPPVG
ncbi:DUF2188 domain-containing protein [Streptosporangium subroseum]|uniref:DUF2188 domain-containing protein n=1 Tax=Streptosporangium subroseum TaxID=106412 RepID=UPI0030905CC9|nr:DUF2188 domain-containing protein [Streptosporangium subroseum]